MWASRWLLVLCIGCILGCSSYTGQAPVSGPGMPVREAPIQDLAPPPSHRVAPGETLYSVAFLYGLSYLQLAYWNRLAAPYVIVAGQSLRLRPPVSWAGGRRPSPVSGQSRLDSKGRVSTPERTLPRAEPPASPGNERELRWVWPTSGPVIRPFSPDGIGKKGIDIGGRQGQSVVAAAAGKIVYSGSGLKGYGKLIIIKHNKRYLSAYAHNRSLTTKEGDWVRQGQRIAEMGNTDAARVMLHFEIRRHGKPVDPLKYLPANGPGERGR